jgi:ERCC4-type nuclease
MSENKQTGSFPTTILRDTREQHPWEFEEFSVETQDVTLATGDYAVPAHCSHDDESATHHPQYAIERKSAPDFLNSLTWDRDRFKRELQRAAQWRRPLPVVVETSWHSLLRNRGCMAQRDIHPSQVSGTVGAWAKYYNVAFHFTETRRQAEHCAFLLLVRHKLVRRLDLGSWAGTTRESTIQVQDGSNAQ